MGDRLGAIPLACDTEHGARETDDDVASSRQRHPRYPRKSDATDAKRFATSSDDRRLRVASLRRARTIRLASTTAPHWGVTTQREGLSWSPNVAKDGERSASS
jgi:hypothetical protein